MYDPIPLPCPICEEGQLETTYTIYTATNFRFEQNIYVGCIPCAKAELKLAIKHGNNNGVKVGTLISHLFHQSQIALLKVDHKAVHYALLEKMGLPREASKSNIALLGTYLAVSMIKVDGKVINQEVNVAKDLGKIIFPDFDDGVFQRIFTQAEQLPPVQIVARLLSNILPKQGKRAVFKYLSEISEADSEANFDETVLLIDVAENLNLDPDDIEEMPFFAC